MCSTIVILPHYFKNIHAKGAEKKFQPNILFLLTPKLIIVRKFELLCMQ